MSFNPQLIAKRIFTETCKGNITAVETCMTRLRITIEDKSAVSSEQIKAIDGVLGLVDAPDQLQIIIVPGKVNQVYEQFMILMQEQPTASATSEKSNFAADANVLRERIKQKNATPLKLLLKKLANIFIPLIPAFIGCGMVLGIVSAIGKIVPASVLGGLHFSQTEIGGIAFLIGNGINYGMALFIGYNAAKEFGGTPILGGVLAEIITTQELSHITILGHSAVPARGGVIAVLLVVIFGAYLERYLRKIVPTMLDLFLTPTLVLIYYRIFSDFCVTTARWCDF